jgi:hypothetical protein
LDHFASYFRERRNQIRRRNGYDGAMHTDLLERRESRLATRIRPETGDLNVVEVTAVGVASFAQFTEIRE